MRNGGLLSFSATESLCLKSISDLSAERIDIRSAFRISLASYRVDKDFLVKLSSCVLSRKVVCEIPH